MTLYIYDLIILFIRQKIHFVLTHMIHLRSQIGRFSELNKERKL